MSKHDNLRINLYFALILAASAVISYNLFTLTYIKHDSYLRIAEAQSQNIKNVLTRGNIYIKPEYLVATNKKFPLVFIVSAEVNQEKKEDIVSQASLILSIEKEKLQEVINTRSDNFKVVSRKINNDQVDAIKLLNTKGLGVAYETDRFYPGSFLASNVIGFLGYSGDDKSGQYGVEAFYNDELFGKKWSFDGYTAGNPVNFIVKLLNKLYKKDNAKSEATIDRPADIILTIDKNIQQIVENKLDVLMKKLKAVGGTIIVQDPNTGKILAMADRPTFDPNSYSEYTPKDFLNRGVQQIFEPGSSFKPITMAMGLDLGLVSPQDTFTDIGFREISGYKIKNFSDKVFGIQTMSQVLEKSINTGAMHVQDLMGDDNFLNYIINFGFGQKTGIDLPGEVNGDITNLYSGRKINFLTASFGQGIAVTPIQLINAYSTIANGGKLLRPYVVEKIVKEDGSEEITEPEIIAIPISEKTATKLKSMLVNVVDNGFDKARISGYDIAGKTGTAQIPNERGGYLENEYIHNFVGFAPAFEPTFVILIKIDKPHGIMFAADSLSPAFRDLAQYLLSYYSIPPTRR